jgi:hypothetical protein
MMWFRLKALLSCILLLLVSSPQAFCQTQQKTNINGVLLSVDSTGVRATQISKPNEPISIGLSDSEQKIGTSGGEAAPGLIQPLTSSKCQWIRFHLYGTRCKWFVLKPGCYAAKTLTSCIQSNGEVLVDFCRFDRLRCTDGSGEHLETHYAISSNPTCGIEELTWMTPNELNNYQMHFDEPPYLTSTWALWQKIIIDDFTKSAEFKDKGSISIKLLNNGLWIEGLDIGDYPNVK